MKRKLFTVLLTITLMLGLATPASAELNKDVRDSVVVVSILMDTDLGEIQFSTGTGFFINEKYLITNYHVVDSFIEWGSGELMPLTIDSVEIYGRAKIRVYYDSSDYEEAYLVGYDSIRDIAILRLDKATTKRVPLELKIPTEDMVGTTIYAVGFPGIAENIIADATESWGKNGATVTSGTISRLLTQSGTGKQNVQIDCDIKHGNSGGPVVTSEGEVIGIATWGVSEQTESLYYAVNIADAILLLNQYSVDYTLASDNPVNDDLTLDQDVIKPEPDNNLSVILICGAAALIIVALLVVIIMLRKKNKSANVPATPVVPMLRPVARSYSKSNYGATINVEQQPILIGRGGNCAMRFPGNAPGISGTHCSVQWDPVTKDFIVTDLNSTYGTFLMSGQKIQPHQPYRLRSGDRFYLAEQSNTISLNLE